MYRAEEFFASLQEVFKNYSSRIVPNGEIDWSLTSRCSFFINQAMEIRLNAALKTDVM